MTLTTSRLCYNSSPFLFFFLSAYKHASRAPVQSAKIFMLTITRLPSIYFSASLLLTVPLPAAAAAVYPLAVEADSSSIFTPLASSNETHPANFCSAIFFFFWTQSGSFLAAYYPPALVRSLQAPLHFCSPPQPRPTTHAAIWIASVLAGVCK